MHLCINGLWYNHMTQKGMVIISKTIKTAPMLGYGLFFKDSNNGTTLVDGVETMMTLRVWYLSIHGHCS